MVPGFANNTWDSAGFSAVRGGPRPREVEGGVEPQDAHDAHDADDARALGHGHLWSTGLGLYGLGTAAHGRWRISIRVSYDSLN